MYAIRSYYGCSEALNRTAPFYWPGITYFRHHPGRDIRAAGTPEKDERFEMIQFPQIDPVIFSIGPLSVRWYGLMYVLGFTATYFLVKKQIRDFKYQVLEEHFENLNLTLILCVILGGRLGYVVFYNLPYYIKHPLEIV